MKKGRSNYTFHLNCDVNIVVGVIQSYLSAEGFSKINKNGEDFYRAGDAMVGYRDFNYSISDTELTISAWFAGAFGDVSVEQNSLNIQAMNYRNSLNALFQEIERVNNNGGIMNNNNINFDPMTGQPIQNNGQYNQNGTQYSQNNVSNFTQKFQNETTKKQEKMCEIGFWISIFGLLASFFGVSYGLLVYIMDFYFASQGLKTKKRGKAIATIVMSIISILISILVLMSA